MKIVKLLRYMRRRLLVESRFTRYLLYALGEIVLVVIRILISLQIINRNQSKKTRAQVRISLTALKSDLIKDTVLITERWPYVIEQKQLNESFRSRAASPRATLDTLIKIARYEFNPRWYDQLLRGYER